MDCIKVESNGELYHMVKVTPPQTNDCEIAVGKGAYCFVIDVSGRCDRGGARGGPSGGAWGGKKGNGEGVRWCTPPAGRSPAAPCRGPAPAA